MPADLIGFKLHPRVAEKEHEAVVRLLDVGRGHTGQSGRVASFLLAWWDAESFGGFDLTDMWAVDEAIARDMMTVLGLIARVHSYPDTLGYGDLLRDVVRAGLPAPADRSASGRTERQP